MAKPRPKTARGTPGADRYPELVRRFPLRPIRSEEELDRATAMIDALVDLPERDGDEVDYLDVLSDLVEKYEAVAHPIPAATDGDLIRHLIEARDVTQARLAADVGIAESTISGVLAGKRRLTWPQVSALARYFHISPATFLDE
ncbi:MAG TPA: helix-turn-helix domain-containing protein [Isosphaeraceae bacterium]|jgi:HTH-type transcriptional regulator/antitoxin HigA|nr:helix-turn-helix domain-containing protein [Isosphaeraceae bacterium]